MKTAPAFQDHYADDVSHCYGCGRLNPHGMHIKSYWDGDVSVCTFRPKPYHTAVKGFVYGGLIASLMDCHATGTAAAAACREEGREMAAGLQHRYVTASLHVDYLRPTPIDGDLILHGRILSIQGKKTVVAVDLHADGHVCARGEVVAVRMPETMTPGSR